MTWCHLAMSHPVALTSRRLLCPVLATWSILSWCFQHGWELHSKHCRWSRTEVTKYGKQQRPRFRTSGRNSVNIYIQSHWEKSRWADHNFTLWERESRTNESKSTYVFVLCTPMDSFGCQCMKRATHMRIVQTPVPCERQIHPSPLEPTYLCLTPNVFLTIFNL